MGFPPINILNATSRKRKVAAMVQEYVDENDRIRFSITMKMPDGGYITEYDHSITTRQQAEDLADEWLSKYIHNPNSPIPF